MEKEAWSWIRKKNRNEAERCRELAQRIGRELGPASVQVLGGVGALAKGTGSDRCRAACRGALPELLVVVDPEWVTLPQQLADRVLLVCSDATMPWLTAQSSWRSRAFTAIFSGRAGAKR